MEEKYWIGTDLKFAITITADGFSMDDDDYEITVGNGSKQVVVEKAKIVNGANGEHLLLLDTTQFPSGTIHIVVSAKVRDNDFDTGVRREVWAKDLCLIQHPW